jgi:hypothetical protein
VRAAMKDFGWNALLKNKKTPQKSGDFSGFFT